MEYSTIGAWDIRVTLDLYLGGIGVGAFLLSVLLSIYDSKKHRTIIKLGAYTAPIMVCLGLLLLITKLGVPLKFVTTIWNVNLQSVMSIGVFLQLGFVVSSAVYAFLIFKKESIDFMFRLWQIIGTFFAFSVGLYHGLFMSSLGRVLWTELIPGIFLASSLATGIAFVYLLERIVEYRGNTVPKVEKIQERLPLGLNRFRVMLVTILLVQLVSIVLWQFYTGRLELEQALIYKYFMQEYGVIWIAVVLIGGTLIPMSIAFISLMRHEVRMTSLATIVTSVLILCGGFIMKHLLVIGGQVSLPVGFLF